MTDYVKDVMKMFKEGDKVRRASDFPNVEVIPTGIEELDSVVLGIGGLPRGHITTLWGPYECGKSTLVGAVVANMHKHNLGKYGGTIAVFDSEGKFYPDWWKQWGVDLERLLMFKFTCGEEAFDQMMQLFGKVDMIVLDSIASLVSREKATRQADEKERIGSEARMIRDKIMDVKNGTYTRHAKTRKITGINTPKLGDTDTVLVIINQVRANIGMIYGPKDRMPGGNINKHLQSLLIRMDIIGYGKDRDAQGGIKLQKVRIRCERNHYAPPRRYAEVWLDVEKPAFETVNSSYLTNMAEDKGIIERRGSWIYSKDIPEEKIQGSEKFIEFLNTPEGEALKKQILGDVVLKEDPETEEVLTPEQPQVTEIEETTLEK